jgi:hypothetical protein
VTRLLGRREINSKRRRDVREPLIVVAGSRRMKRGLFLRLYVMRDDVRRGLFGRGGSVHRSIGAVRLLELVEKLAVLHRSRSNGSSDNRIADGSGKVLRYLPDNCPNGLSCGFCGFRDDDMGRPEHCPGSGVLATLRAISPAVIGPWPSRSESASCPGKATTPGDSIRSSAFDRAFRYGSGEALPRRSAPSADKVLGIA